MASMQDFAPGGRFFYGGQYEQRRPWEEQPLVQDPNKYKPSLFWEDQKRRLDETSWFENAPWWVQGPGDWFKRKMLEGEIATAESGEAVRDVISGLGESKKEREVRLDAERMEAAAKKQEIAQAERRMPYPVAPTPKIEEDEDNFNKLLAYMFIRDIIGGTAGGDPPTPYTVRAGPAARAFPTMPSMFG